MIKLTLLTPDQVSELIARLGGSDELEQANIMLGFLESLSGGTQWRNGMVLTNECAVYDQLFMPVQGNGC